MEKCNIILDELNDTTIRGLFRDYSKEKTRIIFDLDDNFKIECNMYEGITDVYYGKKIDAKYYIARYEEVIERKNRPFINYYDEFFSNGKELEFKGL